MKKIIYILTFLLAVSSCFAQLEYHNWVFGGSHSPTDQNHYKAISFLTKDGSPEYRRIYTPEIKYFEEDEERTHVFGGNALISNFQGDLKYSSDFHSILSFSPDTAIIYYHTAGSGLGSYGPQSQCIINVGNETVIIATETNLLIRNGENLDLENIYFRVITEQNGIINVSRKRTIKQSYGGTSIEIIKDKYSDSFYLIAHDRVENKYYLYKYFEYGFKLLEELESEVKFNENFSPRDLGSPLKVSPSGKYIVSTIMSDDIAYEILKFDEQTETIEFNSTIELELEEGEYISRASGEFSINSEHYYIGGSSLYALTNFNDPDNITLKKVLNNYSSRSTSFYQLGPNGKIYINNNIRKNYNDFELDRYYEYWFISEISNVNDINNVTYNAEALKIDSTHKGGQLGYLPNIPSTYYFQLLTKKDSIELCVGDSLFIENTSVNEPNKISYEWIAPNGKKYRYKNLIIDSVTKDMSGVYQLSTNKNWYKANVEVYVNVLGPEFELDTYRKSICRGDTNTIFIKKPNIKEVNQKVLWNTGDTTSEITINSPGIYSVTVTDFDGCTVTEEIEILDSKPKISVNPLRPTIFCNGDSTILEVKPYDKDNLYIWSTGEIGKQITVKTKGKFSVIVDEGDYCKDTASLNINVKNNLQPTIDGMNICDSNPATLEALPNDPSYSYEWSNGETTPTIVVSQPATYTVTVSKDGCTGKAEFKVNESPTPEFEILGEDIVCDNTATLSSDKDFAEYLWSTDEVTKEIEVTEAGTYSLTVTDENGCQATEKFTVNLVPLSFDIIGEDIVCGSIATLTPDKDFAEYLWSTDEVTKEIEVTEAGTYSLTVTDVNGCSATEEFTVNEQSLSFDISKDRIDFGKVYISETALDSTTIINTSGIDIELANGQIVGDGMPIIFKETLDPTELGPYADSFEHRVISPCDTVITIPVSAEVYAIATISSDEIETEIGAEETISVYLKAEADLGEQTYSITTGIDQSVLFTNDNFTFTNTAPINESKTKIHQINGTIMLASELEYDITFPSYEFNNPYIEVSTEQGKIMIDSVCAFPMRSVTITEATEMMVSPNPAKDKLTIDVTTDVSATLNVPEMTLELISSEGRVAYTENWTQTASSKQLNINTDKIPSGLYQVRLQTPSGVLTENVIVVR